MVDNVKAEAMAGSLGRQVEFDTEDGTRLSGILIVAAVVPAPVIVMTHGFSGVKEQVAHYAAAFARAGFAVLLYDHRGFGSSGGDPRQEVEPWRQLADWQDAISVALAQPEVDEGAGVGLWGSSFAGGLAMVLAANDPRVRCVVAQIPNVGGRANGPAMFNVAERARLERSFAQDRAGRLAGKPPMRVPVLTDDPAALCALPPAVSATYIKAATDAAPTWINEVTLRSIENMLAFEPAGWVPHIAPTPLLMIVAANDTCTFPEPQLACFASAREPKRLLVHRGGHFDTYTRHFAETNEAACAWFGEHLTPTT